MASFFARFDHHGILWKVMSQARSEAHRRLAQAVVPTEIDVALVDRRGRISDFYATPPDVGLLVEAEARRIEAGGEVLPIPVQRQIGQRELYDVLGEFVQFQALVGILRRNKIRVQIAPPAEPLADG